MYQRLIFRLTVCLGIEHPCGTCDQILLPVGMLLSSFCGAPSLTRGRVCNLQCSHLMVRDAQNPKPYSTVSSETPPTWRSRFPYLYPPGRGWPSYTPGHWMCVTLLSRSHVTTNGQSARMSRFRAHSGTCDQILLSVRMLFFESCCLVSVGRPL
jgi:hypothetical protein